jgi:hypothetical protein
MTATTKAYSVNVQMPFPCIFLFFQSSTRWLSYIIVTFFAPSQDRLKRLLHSSCLSVRPTAWNNSALTGRIFIRSDTWAFFFLNLVRKFKSHSNLTRITGNLYEDIFTFIQGGSNMTGTNCDLFTHSQSRSYLNHLVTVSLIFFRVRSVSDETYKGNKTEVLFSITFSFPENRVVYETIWKHVVEPGTPLMTIQRMHFACWISKATRAQTPTHLLAPSPTPASTHAGKHAQKCVILIVSPR